MQALWADVLARHAQPCADIDEELTGAPFSLLPSVPAITPEGALENDPAPPGDWAKPRKRIPEQKEGTYEIRHAPVRRKLAPEQPQKPPIPDQAVGSEEGDDAGEEGDGAEV